eukprot:UN04913
MLGVHLFCGIGNKLSCCFCLITTILYAFVSVFFHPVSYWLITVFYLICTIIITTIMGHFLEFFARKSFYGQHKLLLERARSDTILKTLLPSKVADDLKKGNRVAREVNYKSPNRGVSIMFIQICDFEEKVKNLESETIVKFLNQVFLRFDELTDYWDVYKVKTVGEIYMVASGIPDTCIDPVTGRPDHARRLADMALDVRDFLKMYR